MKRHGDCLVGTTEVPHIADGIAAAPKYCFSAPSAPSRTCATVGASENECIHTHVLLRPGVLDDRPPELLVSLDKADELGCGHRLEGRSADLLHARLYVRIFQGLAEVLPQLLNNCLGCSSGGNECLPADYRETWDGFHCSRQVWKHRQPFARHDRKGLELARVESALETRPGLDDSMNPSAQNVLDRLICAAGRVGQYGEWRFRQPDEEARGQVRKCTGGIGSYDDFVRVAPRQRDELSERIDPEFRRDGEQQTLLACQANRNEITIYIDWQVVLLCRKDSEGGTRRG